MSPAAGTVLSCSFDSVLREWDLADIYKGMMQFMVIQVIDPVLIIIFPQIALWLPEYIYGKLSPAAPLRHHDVAPR